MSVATFSIESLLKNKSELCENLLKNTDVKSRKEILSTEREYCYNHQTYDEIDTSLEDIDDDNSVGSDVSDISDCTSGQSCHLLDPSCLSRYESKCFKLLMEYSRMSQ